MSLCLDGCSLGWIVLMWGSMGWYVEIGFGCGSVL